MDEEILGKVLVCLSGADQAVMHEGVAMGLMKYPTVIIETTGGLQVYWAEHLTRQANEQETIQYWKTRALTAEMKGKS